MIEVVCFDLDDTLCDYETSGKLSRKKLFHYAISKCEAVKLTQFQKAYDMALREMIEHHDREAIFLKMSGKDTWIEHLTRTLKIWGFNNSHLVEELVSIYGNERRKTLKLFPDALPVLSSLREKYSLSLLTNGPSDIQREEIEDLQIESYFDHIIIAGEVGYAKPDPEIFRFLINEYSIPSSQILYVGNSQKHDITSAYKAGLQIAWINRKNEIFNPETSKSHY